MRIWQPAYYIASHRILHRAVRVKLRIVQEVPTRWPALPICTVWLLPYRFATTCTTRLDTRTARERAAESLVRAQRTGCDRRDPGMGFLGADVAAALYDVERVNDLDVNGQL
jgi:hypothetical protein